LKDCTPFHFAASFNSKEVGEVLILNGANIIANDIIYQIMEILYLFTEI